MSLPLIVRGRVQGVSYRAWTQNVARRLGLRGWVRNLPDRSVEITAEGERAALEALLAACREGPPSARVSSIDETWGEDGGFVEFEIRR